MAVIFGSVWQFLVVLAISGNLRCFVISSEIKQKKINSVQSHGSFCQLSAVFSHNISNFQPFQQFLAPCDVLRKVLQPKKCLSQYLNAVHCSMAIFGDFLQFPAVFGNFRPFSASFGNL